MKTRIFSEKLGYQLLDVMLTALFFAFVCGFLIGYASADVPGKKTPAGTTVPLPGTQQQELANITFPVPFNVFEFTVTCMACHGGTIDQQVAHGGNWAGTNMASATRDPVFRANVNIVNGAVNGAGNLCFRCHSPNGWLSGRFDPLLSGSPDGSGVNGVIHSIVLSTDGEGVQCEQCHRAIGGVTMKPTDDFGVPLLNVLDPAWNMLKGLLDWPHAGAAFPQGPGLNMPYGDGTLQYNDAMSYGGKYPGVVEHGVSDQPDFLDPNTGALVPSHYTGQTYGVYPYWWQGPRVPTPIGKPRWNADNEEIAYNPDGSIQTVLEGTNSLGPLCGSISPEHSTWSGDFIKSSEFCGSCHEVTVPIAEHGMPEQRTYTEWKFSAYGDPMSTNFKRCQDCHMPAMKHEYSDTSPVALNPDPVLAGWYPYARDRNPNGGTSFHKLAGANRSLPRMMPLLYPEVDLEVVGAPTGRDTRIFPGMMSSRDETWYRTVRNTELSLRDGASLQILSGPTLNPATGKYEVRVKVTNLTGHKLPSGYPDGRRMWIGLEVRDGAGVVVYRSGFYDPNTATLKTDSNVPFRRALTPVIDSTLENAVMVYEKRTGSINPDNTTFNISQSLLNTEILFDNRIPPLGFIGAEYSAEGAGFHKYTGTESAATPVPDPTRYAEGANFDEVLYIFSPPAGSVPASARAELYYQAHSREFMEHLKAGDTSTVRPEGPPNVLDPNYPLTPTYLSDSLTATTGEDFATLTDLDGGALRDNWGGVAYAAWLLSGKDAPFSMAAADTTVSGPPAAPQGVAAAAFDQFANDITWLAVQSAEGYIVWTRYGLSDATASWDRLAVLFGNNATSYRNDGLNVGKTYGYKVQAFNAAGLGPESLVVTSMTPQDAPLEPLNLTVIGVTSTTISLSWLDQADNETGFVIERQLVPLDPQLPMPPFAEIARIPGNGPGTGGFSFTDGDGTFTPPLEPGRTYNYRVAAYNAAGLSVWNALPVSATTLGPPVAPTNLTWTISQGPGGPIVNLAWLDNAGNETGFLIERATDSNFTQPQPLIQFNVAANPNPSPATTTFDDNTVVANSTYYYRVFATNTYGTSIRSNIITVTTPSTPPAAPTSLTATASLPGPTPPAVTLNWTCPATNETGFVVEQSTDGTNFAQIASLGVNATSYVDSTVQPKMSYWYRVASFNAAGTSAYATTVDPVITPGQIPEAPANLVVTKVTKNSVTLRWEDRSLNEQGFEIQRSVDGGATWVVVTTVGVNVSTFNNKGLTTKTTYMYRVRAFNADGPSAWTDPATTQTK